MSPEDIRANFDRQSMMATLGADLAEVAPGRVTITAPILPGSRQQQGFGHAGLTFAIGDSAAGYAALSMMEDGQDVLTTEMKINLLRPAQGDRLVAVGEVVKPGRRITVVRATVWAETDDRRVEIALLQGTMLPV
ncbi:uncharacterized domain 1-containing protein [Palleronia salina]|uniref:Medium/long-chain acyl-CoA thioesterase YigI n=1 Tax=Palleronia salina TaxID=313368 RepID=A0A1M6EW95_9RHOB|nr:PaaI family thioesterase [Palleronia salina]SHI89712.1 uncharacterized domain 1-containing protein [Palleronia salina]